MATEAEAAAAALLDGLDLDGLLTALARTRGYDVALRDPPGRAAWSDTAVTSLNFAELDARVRALAGLLATNRAQPGSAVAILAPLGPELILSVLACLRAGLSPLPLPPQASEDEVLTLAEASGAALAIGMGRVGALRPLLGLRAVALRSFSMRFVGGFGRDLPDGIAALDTLLANGGLHPLPAQATRAPLLMARGESGERIVALPERELLAAALDLSRALKPLISARIVTTLVGSDLAALASGPAMALLTGVELLPLGLFDLGDLRACITGGRAVHLVIPGAMEPAFAASRLASDRALASLILVHRSGQRALPALDRPDLAIVDVTSDGPTRLAIARR